MRFSFLMTGFAQRIVTSFLHGERYNEVHFRGGGEMVIYADVLFFLNAVVDYLLLLVSARAAGAPLRRKRFAVGGVIGGLYAVAMFFPGFSFLKSRMYVVLFGVLMVVTAYGFTRLLVKQSLIFLGVTCALGGGVLAIGMMDGTVLSLGRHVVYSLPDLKLVMLSAAGCYALLHLVSPMLCRHTRIEGELREITFELLERSLTLTAFFDSGNTLTDPVTGRRIPVAEGAALRVLFPFEDVPNDADLRDPAAGLSRLNKGELAGRFRLLPYRAIGVEQGLLLGVRMDRVTTKAGAETGVLVALSPTPVSDGGGYHVLMGGN